MLEWYRCDADYRDILADTRALLQEVARVTLGAECWNAGGVNVEIGGAWEELTVDQAFSRHAQATPDQAVADGSFEQVLCTHVEPHLGRGRPTVLLDYPPAFAGFARLKAGAPPRAERWELYINGIELANAYTELSDPEEQLSRFARSAELRRADAREVFEVDPRFMDAMRRGMPQAAGIALGIDRLLMVLSGALSLDAVTAFPPEHA